jgi:hypothetical protein
MLHGNRDLVFTDRWGWPEIAGIHDAKLTTLSIEFGTKLMFGLAGAGGEQTSFDLNGLHRLHLESLWEGVIIESISIWRVADFQEEAGIEKGIDVWKALLAGRTHPENHAAEVARLKREYRGSSLVAVSSSYGGELQALCQEVLINGRKVASN